MPKTKGKTANIIKYGKIEIPMNDGKSPFMPQKAGHFVDHGDIMKTLAIAVRDNLPVLMIGESGTGKTSAIRFLANQTGNGLRRVNLNGGTTADELVGRLLINEKGTYWVDGVLTEAMRNGEWIVLDEINAALPEVLFVLQSVLDDDGYLVLNEKDDKEIVHKHANFRMFATCNPPEYEGTKPMNKALLSRFAICINTEFPPTTTELEIIENHLGNVIAKSDMAIKLVDFANETRKAKELGNADYAINTRDILNTLRLAEHTDPIEALSLAFANKLDIGDKKTVKSTARLTLPTSKKKANATRIPVKTTNEMNIGGTYILEADIRDTYYGLTSEITEYEKMINGDIAGIIDMQKESAIKGDEFIIDATYYEDEDLISKQPINNVGGKVASAIKIIGGPNKGKMAVIIHHKDVENSADIINSIYEIK
jgi:MoxR-like ATPase